jgi:hypothetical protein
VALSAAKSRQNQPPFAVCKPDRLVYARGCGKNLKGNMMAKMESKILPKPDEFRAFDQGKVELATLGGVTFGRTTLQPGWKWSMSHKAVVKTKSCEAPHLQY